MTAVLDFAELYEQHAERMLNQALHMLNSNVPDAEDAVSQAWLWALEQQAEYRDEGTPLAWLTVLVKYAALTTIRDRRLLIDFDEVDERADDGEARGTGYPGLEDEVTHQVLAEMWPLLTERQATSVWLRHIGGYTASEGARVMGISKTSFNNAADLGMRRIRWLRSGGNPERRCPACRWPRGSLGHRQACR